MIAKLSPEIARELEQAGEELLPVENPRTKRVYVLVDTERYDIVRRAAKSASDAGDWTEEKNVRRCALIHKKFSQGTSAEEDRELSQLQEELSTFRKRSVPLPYDVVDVLQSAVNAAPPSPTT